MRIGGLDLDDRVLVVAEIGNNHEGDMETAREMVRQAAGAGVHAIKFQTFRPELFVSRLDEKRFDQLSGYALTDDQFGELAELARSQGLLFLSTPLDLESARFLAGLADAIKIASGDITFVPLLREVGAGDLPVIVSTGISSLDEIESAVGEIASARGERPLDLAILHCVSAYPAPPAEANLRAIPALAERFDCTIGYSDHTLGIEAAAAAVALGARVVEKHFTLEGIESDFRDHALSATPSQMRELVTRIETVEPMLGPGGKPVGDEAGGLAVAIQRSVVAVADLSSGHLLDAADIAWVRPGGGVPPGEERALIGGTLSRAIRAGEQIRTEDLEP